MAKDAIDFLPLRRRSLIYPTPVAITCGRAARARNAVERVTACLKAAEVLTRYLAAVAVASFASRSDAAEAKLNALSGNLAFGHFLTIVQEVAGSKANHPVAPLLAQGFRTTRRNKESSRGPADAALVALLVLRNGLGHGLRNLDEGKAAAIEAANSPATILLQALDGVEALLSKPLFVVEDQQWTPEAIVLRRLLLMGESSDPAPHNIRVSHESGGFRTTGTPYIAVNQSCLQLPPWLLWCIDQERENLALHLLDAIEDSRARYCTLQDTQQHQSREVADSIRQLFNGVRRPSDTVVLVDGRHLATEWSDTRKGIEESGLRQEGHLDWLSFEPETVKWYAGLLDPMAADPYALISDRLVDGRTHVDKHELHQLVLLFGTKASVRAELKRDVLDIRVIDDESKRPARRELVESENLLVALRRAVRFLSNELASGALAPEDLRRMGGDVDYITIREMLVNQIIHQDYYASETSAQIELYADKMTLLNAGYSLVPAGELLDGGRSQSRNPLIARALRTIGFAELSGSGIRALLQALRKARRKPPRFSNDETRNTFKVTLEWTEDTPDVDAFWKERVGVRLSSEQALVLNALVELPSASLIALENSTGLPLDGLAKVLDSLVFQVLVEPDEANFRLAQHLREKLG